ncbi:MAG: ArsC family reductase [Sphingobacteriaceae bacterium]|nr:ArsC family reductase [Sphingobacteriaceae bacterium]
MKVYGIKNCDTVKKALNWLDKNNITYEFHDYKKSGISIEKLNEWSAQLGWEPLLNKKGTTWKKLDTETQNKIQTKEAAFNLMQEKTSVIKRPLIEGGSKLLLGFNEADYLEVLGENN